MWELVYTKHARKDAQKLSSAGLKEKTQGFCVKIHFKIHHPMKNWLVIYPELIPGGSTFSIGWFIKF